MPKAKARPKRVVTMAPSPPAQVPTPQATFPPQPTPQAESQGLTPSVTTQSASVSASAPEASAASAGSSAAGSSAESSSPFAAPVVYPPARPAPAAPPPPPPSADGGAPPATQAQASAPTVVAVDSESTSGGSSEPEAKSEPKPKATKEEKEERSRRARAADGYAKMLAALDREFADVMLRDRLVPEELEDVLRRHNLDDDIATAIGFSIEQILEDHPALAGSAGGIGLVATFYLSRVAGTIKQRVDLNDLSSQELKDIRQIQRNYYRQKALEIETAKKANNSKAA
jgi:hypothetical protein